MENKTDDSSGSAASSRIISHREPDDVIEGQWTFVVTESTNVPILIRFF